MKKLSKHRRLILSKVNKKTLSLTDALILIKECSISNFDESIDISIKLSLDFIKSNQIIKGIIFLPYNIVKLNRV